MYSHLRPCLDRNNFKVNISTAADWTEWTLNLEHWVATLILYHKLGVDEGPLLLNGPNHSPWRGGDLRSG